MRALLTETSWDMMAVAKELSAREFLVTRVNGGHDVLQLAEIGRQDFVVIDADLPDMSLPTALKSLARMKSSVPVFVVGSQTPPISTAEILELGADDHFSTPLAFDVVAQRIRAVVRRSAGLARAHIELGDLAIDIQTCQLFCCGKPIHLTRLEYEMIETMALHADRILTRDEIMGQLYGYENEPTEKIIDVYLSRIRRKLRAAGFHGTILQSARNRGHYLDTSRVPRRSVA